jgi:hypothetical protein
LQFTGRDFGGASAGIGILSAIRFVVFGFRDHDKIKTQVSTVTPQVN